MTDLFDSAALAESGRQVSKPLQAPFPWFGGKSRAAALIWEMLGRVDNYVEPFAGSLAVLLGAPRIAKAETVNDLDGFIANFWRATAVAPDEVANHCDWPVNEVDLHARHVWLLEQRQDLTERLMGDPDFFDAKIAGWWCWGICCWIAGGWCSGSGPWTSQGGKFIKLDLGQGVHRQRVSLGDLGRGVHRKRSLRDWFAGRRAKAQRVEVRKADSERQKSKPKRKIEPQIVTSESQPSQRAEREKQQPLFKNLPAGALPPLELLDDPPEQVSGYSTEVLEALSRQVELKLADFGVQVDVVEVHPGPVITRFELQPAPGVKSAQISNLAKDLARGLSVISVRVVEVIPGKSTIGLEIPNTVRQTVYLSEILRSEVYEKSSSPLTLALGKGIGGSPVIAELSRMPHVLVAGTTGSGKSVALNAMILSFLYKATPEQVRLIMIDPKMLELSVYEGIPHLLAPVVTDMKEAANALRWCVAEMERRYRLMASMGVRNISGYNKKIKEAEDKGQPIKDPFWQPALPDVPEETPTLQGFPYIVVVIDEFADMMMIVGKKIEELIARLAQKARAAGIHLIVATQRPSVDVITGLIKANIPARIGFQVSSRVDSRTILDQMGAEQLLGHGDMLYLPPGSALPERIHGAFVGDREVHAVVKYLKQFGEPDYLDDVLNEMQMTVDGMSIGATGLPEAVSGEQDELYDQAVAFVTESRRASISSVQRQLRIGYNRAARLVEEMEAAGVVSPPEHNGQREVLAPPPPRD